MIRDRIALAVVVALIAIAAIVWRNPDPTGESTGQISAVDPEQTPIDRMVEQTLRESRTGVEEPVSEAPPEAASLVGAAQQADGSRQEVSEPEAASSESGVDPDLLPEGYTLGAYRGAMQRAPLTSAPEPELAPNPDWLEPGPAHDEILDQAEGAGREFTFAVLRVLPDTDLQALNRSLAALGSRIEGSTGPYVRVRVPAERSSLEAIAGLDDVLGIGAVPPELKADEAFVQEMLARPASEPVPVYVTLMAQDLAGEWRQALTELGAVVGAYDRDLRSYTANLAPAVLARVLDADFVLSVEPMPVVTVNHATSVPVMGVDGVRQYEPLTESFSGITGSGIAVGVLDTGLNSSHVDIVRGRASICGANFVTGEDWDLWVDLGGHGTHVFGTIAGSGHSDPVFSGIAPGVSHLRIGKVLSYRGRGFIDDIRRGMDFLSQAATCTWRGTRSEAAIPLVVNMSLSANSLEFSGRGVGERKLDSVVQAHSQLYVVSQANSGIYGFSNFGTAKNSLAVGGVEDFGIILFSSSRGPTADGRLLPNVVGAGGGLTSARGSASVSGHETISGTSMASASVAGVAALLMAARPEFRGQPALARARLMASAIRPHVYLESRAQLPADNTGGPGDFNNLYGLGLVSAQTTLFSRDGPEGWLIGSASAEPDNDSYEYIDIEVPEGAGRLDVVLTWDEQPADTLTRSVLNNLDLWADAGADCSEEACGEHSSRSEIDNVEWLLIEDPVPGTYRIKVVPVEVYGEPSTAAVAWKILRGEPAPQLEVAHGDAADSADGEFVTVDVTVSADGYVASGTSLHFNCRRNQRRCSGSDGAVRPYSYRVYRSDGLHWSNPGTDLHFPPDPIAIGEVATGTPRRVQLRFLRENIRTANDLVVTASSWNARGAVKGLAIGSDAVESDESAGRIAAPANDDFSRAERVEGASGQTPLDLVFASREPGESKVSPVTRTLWYAWEAPSNGLFRFRLEQADTLLPSFFDFALFTGDSLVDLDTVAEKHGSEIGFAAQEGVVYRLRIASVRWESEPMVLLWESADTRPANDDLAYARILEGERGSLEATNEGATLESFEFLAGAASTVWYQWTAQQDGWWRVNVNRHWLEVSVFVGDRVDGLRLVSLRAPEAPGTAYFPAARGETYRIVVASRSAEDSGARFTLRWEPSESLPAGYATNDLFENAIEIADAEGSADQFDSGRYGDLLYSVEHSEPVESGIGTGWWQWTAPSDGRFTWRMDGSPDDSLTIFAGEALADLQFVGTLNGGASFVLDATRDTRYWIAVGHASEAIRVDRDRPRRFRWGPTPANDDRTTAALIAGVTGTAEAVLQYATKASNDPVDTVGTDSVWWRWRAPTSGWQRFWVQDQPLSTILAVYTDGAPTRAIADSERTFLANGRVEVHLRVQAGHSYEIRLAARPATTADASTTLRWEPSEAPPHIAYKGAVTLESFAADPRARGFRSPFNLAVSENGHYLFSTSDGGVFALARDPETGDIAPALGAPESTTRDSSSTDPLDRAFLWWNTRDDRLHAYGVGQSASFEVAGDGSTALQRWPLETHGGGSVFSATPYPAIGTTDGRHFYAADRDRRWLQAFSVESPTTLSHLQTVSANGTPADDSLIVPGFGSARDMALSSDGHYLYVVTENALLVFTRNVSNGLLDLSRQIPADSTPDNPLRELISLENVSLDGTGAVLFVSGTNYSTVTRTAIAAFDISADPSNPAHLDTLLGLHVEQDEDARYAWSHLLSLIRVTWDCTTVLPRPGRTGVDIFCSNGFRVVEWNPATRALEVTDFAVSGAEDRFGNLLPAHLGGERFERRQMAQSPDGAYLYRATSIEDGELSDAIHIYERASGM